VINSSSKISFGKREKKRKAMSHNRRGGTEHTADESGTKCLVEKGNNRFVSLTLNARAIDFEIFGATLVGLALELSGTQLALHSRHALGSAFKFLGGIELLVVLVVYIYRFYSNVPDAGRMALLIGYLLLLFCMTAFVFWSAIDSVLIH
jgi:hypothetical protein